MSDVKRPSMDKELYNHVKRYCVGKSDTIKSIVEQGAMVVVSEQGEVREGWRRLTEFAESKDAARYEVINHVLVQIIDEDGDADIKFKERLSLDDL